MFRLLEIIFAVFLLIIMLLPLLIISILIKIDSKGPVIHFSKRIGKNNKIFYMPKFRTMKIDTPQIDTNNFTNSYVYVTSVGKILRKYSLDEIPQILSIITNSMSFIGPRPALFNQYDLIKLRNKNKINMLRPGITGWAQVNGRDNISIEKKVELEVYFLKNKSPLLYLKILYKTFLIIITKKDIKH